MRVLVALGGDGEVDGLLPALQAEGFAASASVDILRLVGGVEDDILGAGAPAAAVLGCAPLAVLTAAVTALRGGAATARVPVLVYRPGLGLNERARVMAAGADDCQTRAAAGVILAARVRALLRRSPAGAQDETRLSVGSLRLDLVKRSAEAGGRELLPTRLQFDILAALARGGEAGSAPEALLAGLQRRGHEVEAPALRACLDALAAELLAAGLDLARDGDRVRVVDASPERRALAAALELASALAAVASNVRFYRDDHASVAGPAAAACRAAQRLRQGDSDLRVQCHGAELRFDAAGLSVPAPPAVSALFVALGAEALDIHVEAAPADICRLARAALAARSAGKPADLAAWLTGAGVRGVAPAPA